MAAQGAAIAGASQRTVLVIYSSSRLLPANVEGDRGLRRAILNTAERPVLVLDEYLDMPRLGGPAHEDTLRAYLTGKYGTQPPQLVIAAGELALAFLLAHRQTLFARTPLMHMGVSVAALQRMQPLPQDVVGIPVYYDFERTIEQAFRWHPRARQLVLVTGSATLDRGFEARLRAAMPRFADRAQAVYLTALPYDEVLRRLHALPSDALVFTPGFYADGTGRAFTPRESAEAMAAASSAPVYGPFHTFLGTGVVGGFVTPFEDSGRKAGEIANQLLGGAAPGSLRLPAVMPAVLHVDWRQLQRWGIDERAVPRDAVIMFRTPGFFESHWLEVGLGATVIVLQAALIGGLLLERRRRRHAEQSEQERRRELAHASRLALAGEMTASIAHEINQPLGAILSNADTAELLLESGADRREELRAIVADIRRDDLRASQVIRRLRQLLARQQVERQRFELDTVVRDTLPLLQAEATRRHITLDLDIASCPMPMVGDRTQLQQVLINLVLNAMDSVNGLPEPRRTVQVSLARDGDRLRLTVRDRGKGIAGEDLPKLFDPFFSTKHQGMGLGLSISRTLVEANGGQIRAAHGDVEGALFEVVVPACAEPTVARSAAS